MVLLNENICLVGTYENGWFKADSKSFGMFGISYDTVAPTIVLPSSKKKTSTSSIRFKVADNLSGIADYHVYVNGIWQIAEYDAKSATISCYFTEVNPKNLKIEVIDRLGNKAVLEKVIGF
jgi:hypothetical protein